MSLKVLQLDNFNLTSSDDKLKLSVTSAVDIKVPRTLSSLDADATIKALTSGKIWVSRGISCHLAVRVFIDGKPLDNAISLHLLESLGCHLHGLKLWSLLSFSTSLDVLQTKRLEEQPDIAVHINHGTQVPEVERRVKRAWELKNTDIKPPDSILCAELERLQINFDFLTIKAKPPRSTCLEAGPGPDIMLLDVPPNMHGGIYFQELNFTADRLQEHKNSAETCFNIGECVESGEMPRCNNKADLPLLAKDEDNGQVCGLRSKKTKFSREIVDTLVAWLESHANNTRPTEAEKLDLMRQTGLQRAQLNAWLRYQRKKKLSTSPIENDELESVVRRLQTLSKSIEDWFGLGKAADSGSTSAQSARNMKFAPEITDTLVEWFELSAGKTPTPDEKLALMSRTGLQKSQLNNWLNRRRRKYLLPLKAENDEMLFNDNPPAKNIEDDTDMLLSEFALEAGEFLDGNIYGKQRGVEGSQDNDDDMLLARPVQEDQAHLQTPSLQPPETNFKQTNQEDMLLSQFTINTEAVPSLASKSSIASVATISTLETGTSNLQGDGLNKFLLDITAICKLAALGLHIVVSGYDCRSYQGLSAITIENPPEITVSRTVPALFSPGFKLSIALNAHFLPTISHAISISWPKNALSPTVKHKLLKLASSSPSNDTYGMRESGTSERLSAVIQARLWGIMQRKLYDPSTARKLWRQSEGRPGVIGELDEFEDLFEVNEEDKDEDLFGDLGEDDFDDLLADEEDDLLDYLEDSERERLAVEQETDEMLFGNGWDEDEDEDELLFFEEEDDDEDDLLLERGDDCVTVLLGGEESDGMLV